MRIAVFVTGPTASGKTTLVRKLGRMGWSTLHTGELFREKEGNTIHKDNPVAPDAADNYIKNKLAELLDTNRGMPNLVAVEAIPRKESQIKWVGLAEKFGYIPIVYFMEADVHIRRNRVISRDSFDTERLELDMKKLEAEEEKVDFAQIKRMCDFKHYYETQVLDTSAETDDKVINLDLTALEVMSNISYNLFKERRIAIGDKLNIDVGHMLSRARDELDEAIACHDHSFCCLEEIVDCIWFLTLAVKGMKYTPQDLFNMYINKSQVNGHRVDTGAKPHASKMAT